MLSLTDQTGRRVAAAALRNCFYLAPIGVLAFAGTVLSPLSQSITNTDLMKQPRLADMVNEDFLPFNFTVLLPYLHCNYRIFTVCTL